MKKIFFDKRLPKGIKIFKNDFKEYVAIDCNDFKEYVAQYKGNAISASYSLEGAILNYLTKNTMDHFVTK